MSSAVVRKFLDATSEILDVIGLRNRIEVSPIFLIMSLVIVVLTSFTTSLYVVVLTLVASVTILATTHNSRIHVRKLFSALVYVFLFSLVALTPFLIRGSASLYFFYVFRAASSTSFLLAVTTVLGWESLGKFMRRLKLPNVTLVLMIYVKVISVLLRDTSRILFAREARLFKNSGVRSLLNYTTVIGDLMIRSSERSKRAFLAVEARRFGRLPEKTCSHKLFEPSRLDVLVSLVAFAELWVCLAGVRV
ncbi:MAG: energy-coupling factor transporter transmembrane component T family protein [Thermoprotei archaeon]